MPKDKCDLCDSPAVVHETTMKKGVKREVHLCEEHAKAAGITLPGTTQQLNQVLTQFVISSSSSSTPAAKPKIKAVRKICPTCELSFARFRQNGVVGCPDCYRTFEKHLGPLIERAQNGAISHVGKAPRRAGVSIDRQLLIQRMHKELDHAVAAEQYERAAELRDQLTSLKTSVAPERD